MKLVGASGQFVKHPTFNNSGTIASGGTAQLILPERPRCSMILVQNISTASMYLEIGSARATATLTSGVVTSVSITNAGFGFTVPPIVEFIGGGDSSANPNYLGAPLPGVQAPTNVATGIAVLGTGGSAGTVASITIVNGGAHYTKAPLVFIRNSENDPYGCATPSATSGIFLSPNGGSFYENGTCCTTDALAIYCPTSSSAYTVCYMD